MEFTGGCVEREGWQVAPVLCSGYCAGSGVALMGVVGRLVVVDLLVVTFYVGKFTRPRQRHSRGAMRGPLIRSPIVTRRKSACCLCSAK